MKIKKDKVLFLAKNNKKLIVGAFLLIFVCGLIVNFNKGTFSIDDLEVSDSLTINCSDVALTSDNIECLIVLDSITFATQGVLAKYEVSDGLTFESFTVDENWVDYSDEQKDGFLLVSKSDEGFSGENIALGTVKFKLPDNVSSNSVFRVELVDVEIGDGELATIKFDEVYDEIRVVSDIAKLDSLEINNGDIELSPSFSSDVLEYSATVVNNVDKVNVNAVLTENVIGSISGDIGELNLHYGTNDFEIIVTAEDGNTISTYKLSVYREYEFEYDGVYSYNKDGNYLYTKNDVDKNVIITNLGILDNGLVYDMNNDNTKLYIKYIDEILLEVDIINFGINNHIVDNHIYINDLTIEGFIDTIDKNKVDIKIVDGDGLEVTSGKILDDYKLNVYYNDTLLDSYSFKSEYLEISNSIIVDDQNKIFNRLVLGTTYAEIKEMIDTNGEITIISHDDSEIVDGSVVRTGDKVKIKFSDEEVIYSLSVLGDLNGDGIVTVGDVSIVYRYLKGRIELDMIFANAANIINDDGITVGDVSRLYRYLKNRVPTLEVIE